MLSACSPAASTGAGARSGAEAAPGQPKILIWAGLREPAAFDSVIGLGGSGSPAAEVTPVVHDFLVVANHRSEPVAQLAVARPSVSDGTWHLNADGSMDTTWRLRPHIKWHDGTPLTSDDLLFAFNLSIDPQLPKSQFGGLPYMASADAPDPLTMVIHWSATYSHADREVGLGPLPPRLLAEHYRGAKEDFLNHPYFSTAFVGLGPYRLVHWEPGAHMEFARSDDYYLGRPRLDGVIVRFIGDPVTMLANAEAGAVDIATPALSANLDAISQLRVRWEGTMNRVIFDPSDSLRHLQLQFRPEFARPMGGLTNQTVRQALYTALDRQALTDLMTHGAAPTADSYLPAVDRMRPLVESAIPQYPHNPTRALQLLAEAGWVRGADGALVRQPGGERFEIDVWGRPGSASENELSLISDNWKAIGAQPTSYMIPVQRVTDRQLLATYSGVLLHNPPWEGIYENRLATRDIANDGNRWSGRNAAGYSNPRVDALVDALLVAIEPERQVALHRDLLNAVMTDVVFMPLYWVIQPALVRGRVKGDVTAFHAGWNIFDWDLES